MRERFVPATLAATLAVVLLTGIGSAAAATDPGPVGFGPVPVVPAPGSAPTPETYEVTLITGDRVHLDVFPDGRQSATVDPASRGDNRPEPTFEIREIEGDLHVFPSDVKRYVGPKLDRDLFDVSELVDQGFHDGEAQSLPVIVDYERTVGPLPPSLDRLRTLESIAAVATRQPKENAAAFGRAVAADATLLAGVDKIWLDKKVETTLDESVPQIGAPTAWAAGYDGTGTTVAVLDTGIDATHPDLAGKVAVARNFCTFCADESDHHGHGTHVAATIAGSGAASGGARKGVAQGANLLNGKVISDFGFGFSSWMIDGMEWAAAEEQADVVNMSLGAGASDGTDPLSQALNTLTETYGTLFVVAAGNSGPSSQTVEAPGVAAQALTVGAVDKSDVLAAFSSRGPRLGDYAIKPDITAPGVGIVAARAAGTSIGEPVDDFYSRLSGTSMATPHVAGAAALLAQRHPGWDADELKAALVTTASPGSSTVYEQGGGRVDVARAFTQPAVLAAPVPLDLGFFPSPHRKSAPVTRTVTYTNTSDAEVTLDLALEVTDEEGRAPAPPTMLALSRSAVTLAAGGSGQVDVTLDTTLGFAGPYGGYLAARTADGSVVLRIPVGFYKEPDHNPWRLQATLPRTAVIKDISFASPTVGYAVGELGKVWKTTDGGETWTQIMNVGFPYYWYGVDTLSENDVVISGFKTGTFADIRGLLRWSHDGGQTWGPDVVLTTRGWANRVRFADAQHGLVLTVSVLDRRDAFYTTTGGQTEADWTATTIAPWSGWFGNQFSLLPNLRARASGIHYCDSLDGGASWSCIPFGIDEVFDGATFFLDDKNGWVGGGSIAPTVEGWLHRTTDGGATWSGRTLAAKWPVRQIHFVTKKLGWAAGGNIYSGGGGLYFSKDGGQTWSLDLDAGAELVSCDGWWHNPVKFQVWCAGYDGSFRGKIYTLTRTVLPEQAEGAGG
jgi:subtilisin family serine protease